MFRLVFVLERLNLFGKSYWHRGQEVEGRIASVAGCGNALDRSHLFVIDIPESHDTFAIPEKYVCEVLADDPPLRDERLFVVSQPGNFTAENIFLVELQKGPQYVTGVDMNRFLASLGMEYPAFKAFMEEKAAAGEEVVFVTKGRGVPRAAEWHLFEESELVRRAKK